MHQMINAVKKKMVDGILWQSSGLGLCTLSAEGPSLIPGQGTNTSHHKLGDLAKNKKKENGR